MSGWNGVLLDALKRAAFTFLGVIIFYVRPRKRVVVVLSSMRSGSTLLKTLLGQADDISLIDEFHFVPYARSGKFFFYYLVYRLSDKPILVLKKPYNNVSEQLPDYGVVPLDDALLVVLFRNPYDTLLSLKVLQERKGYRVFSDEECVDYWCDAYEAVFHNVEFDDKVLFVSYEELTHKPAKVTKEMFAFIGSQSQTGVEGYDDYEWKHGRDDDSEKIRSRKVHQAISAGPDQDPSLYAAIENSERMSELYARLKHECARQHASGVGAEAGGEGRTFKGEAR